MSPAILLLLALALGLAGWLAARARAWTFKRAQPGVRLAALPSYHGWYVALWIVIPAVLFAMVWAALSPNLVLQSVLASPAAADLPSFGLQRQTMLAEARYVALGNSPAVFNPAAAGLVEPFRTAISFYNWIGLAATLVIELLALSVSQEAMAVVALFTSILLGLEAQALRRWSLARKGWRVVGIVDAHNKSEAELRFLHKAADRVSPPRPQIDRQQRPASQPIIPRIGSEQVVGLTLGPETRQ